MSTGAMSSSAENDKVRDFTGIQAIPDMFFGHNSVLIKVNSTEIDMNPRDAILGSFLKIQENAREDLCSMVIAPSVLCPSIRGQIMGKLKVSHSGKWEANHLNPNVRQLNFAHDWTFTSTYWGRCRQYESAKYLPGEELHDDFLPKGKIADTSLKILLFKELEFWEDELDDSGCSRMSVKMRFMETFFLILMKCEVRVDGVLASRSIETRFFYEYGSGDLRREFRWYENGSEIRNLRVAQAIEIS
jgi:hypothetical protein